MATLKPAARRNTAVPNTGAEVAAMVAGAPTPAPLSETYKSLEGKWVRFAKDTPKRRSCEGFGLATVPLERSFTIRGIRRVLSGKPTFGFYAIGTFDDGKRIDLYLSLSDVLEESDEVPDPKYLNYTKNAALVSPKYHNYVGTDPEFFLLTSKGELLPAFEFAVSTAHGAPGIPFVDGYQVEFNTPALTCLEQFTSHVEQGILNTIQRAQAVSRGAYISHKSTADVTEERLRSDPPKWTKFGCTPSKNIYGETFPTMDPLAVPFRTAGGHMHFSLWHKSTALNERVVKVLDQILGVVSVSLFQYYDEPRRRAFYGRAGEYRDTSYGLEYRVLSNAWLMHPISLMFTWEFSRLVLGLVPHGREKNWVASDEEVRNCINNCDVALAHEILERNSGMLVAMLRRMPGTGDYSSAERWQEIIRDGIHSVLKTPDDIYSNWNGNTNRFLSQTTYSLLNRTTRI